MNDIQPYQFEPEGTLQEVDDSKWLRNYAKRNYNPGQYRDRQCVVRAFQFSPSRLRIWLPSSCTAVMAAL